VAAGLAELQVSERLWIAGQLDARHIDDVRLVTSRDRGERGRHGDQQNAEQRDGHIPSSTDYEHRLISS
jgi:hypothetical protein